jgi:hypothetical protein
MSDYDGCGPVIRIQSRAKSRLNQNDNPSILADLGRCDNSLDNTTTRPAKGRLGSKKILTEAPTITNPLVFLSDCAAISTSPMARVRPDPLRTGSASRAGAQKAKTHTHSLFRQGRMRYELIPAMPAVRLTPLMARFAEAGSRCRSFSGLLEVI